MDYTIVIPAYNEEELLPRTLQGVRDAMAAIPLSGEVIVVDNNSTDATASVAESNGARVVFEPINQIARARNRGAQAAQGRFLLFVDADTTISADLLTAALAALADGATCGGGATLSTSDTIPKAAARMITLWNWISRRSQVAAGCFLFCLREGWEAVGGFPTSLYAGEELKFSRALRRWGKKRGLRFRILPQRVDTSMRKVEWFTPWQIRRRMLGYMLFPWRLRRRDACAIWYERPKTTTPPPDNEDTHHA